MPVLTDETKYQILGQLVANPEMSQRELARELGISVGKTNYCLKALLDKGWIKISRFSQSSNKTAYAYVLTLKGMEEKARITVNFLKRKQQEYDELAKELETLRREAAELQSSDTELHES